MAQEMLDRLRTLPWRRVDVCFKGTSTPFMAHNHIQVGGANTLGPTPPAACLLLHRHYPDVCILSSARSRRVRVLIKQSLSLGMGSRLTQALVN